MIQRNKEWRNSMRLKLDTNNMMEKIIGKNGFTDAELAAMKNQATTAFQFVEENRGKGMMAWTSLPSNQDDVVKDILAKAKEVRKKFKYFVILGIGGSALGPYALFKALCHLHHNELPLSKRKAPKFYVEDNIDPERMNALLDIIEPEKTCFNIITKSGTTSETMAQFLIIHDILSKLLGDKASENIIATTDSSKGALLKIAQKHNYKTFYIDSGVGGRFSLLSPVGLFPAAVLGLDIKGLLQGAEYLNNNYKKSQLYKNPALLAATLQYLAEKKGKNIQVLMPYADGLKYFSDWYAQLWAESLGKIKKLDGSSCAPVGQTPVKALGVTDQHSQVQLYVEGPNDKVITFLKVQDFRSFCVIPRSNLNIPEIQFLEGQSLNELIKAEQHATEYALLKAERQNMTIVLPQVNEFTIGELIYFFELQTAYMGALLEIDTYNQPGVEESKVATFALMGKNGYEDKRHELANMKKDEKYVLD